MPPVPTPCRILIVDDHVDSAESLARLLKAQGHESMYLTTPEPVEDVMRSFSPHVVLLDIAMPVLDGWSLARKIRSERDFDQVKLVAVTAFAHAEAYASSRKAGFDAHLAKPVDLDALSAMLEQCFLDPPVRLR